MKLRGTCDNCGNEHACAPADVAVYKPTPQFLTIAQCSLIPCPGPQIHDCTDRSHPLAVDVLTLTPETPLSARVDLVPGTGFLIVRLAP